MTEDRLLTPFEIRAWAWQTWRAMSPRDRKLVALALASLLGDELDRAA